MLNKKILSILCVLIVVSFSNLVTKDLNLDDNNMHNEVKAFGRFGYDILDELKESQKRAKKLKPTENLEIQNYYENYPKNYVGEYGDEDGILNVNIAQDKNYEAGKPDFSNEEYNDGFYKYHIVKYSKEQLDAAMAKLGDKMKEFDIDGLAIDAEKNKLLVEIYKIDDIKKNKVMEYIDAPFIEFRNCESRASFAPLIKQINK